MITRITELSDEGGGVPRLGRRPGPEVNTDTDAIIRVDATTCGTDQHILKGDVPAVTDGRILDHKADGIQAELERVPFADTSTHLVPPSPKTDPPQRRGRKQLHPHGHRVAFIILGR